MYMKVCTKVGLYSAVRWRVIAYEFFNLFQVKSCSFIRYGMCERRGRHQVYCAHLSSLSILVPLIVHAILIQILIVCSSQLPISVRSSSSIPPHSASLRVLCCSIIRSFLGLCCPDQYPVRPHNTCTVFGCTEKSD